MYNIYFIIRTVMTPETAVLGIRNVYPGSGIFPSRIQQKRGKNGGKTVKLYYLFCSFSLFKQQALTHNYCTFKIVYHTYYYLSLQKSRGLIRDPEKTYPGSGSATLVNGPSADT
jgi:hypothetical protein